MDIYKELAAVCGGCNASFILILSQLERVMSAQSRPVRGAKRDRLLVQKVNSL
ncbi:MAG: hypothetical protein ACHBN1_21645 [Heteroscytonema crispum UTEX LB 1556]